MQSSLHMMTVADILSLAGSGRNEDAAAPTCGGRQAQRGCELAQLMINQRRHRHAATNAGFVRANVF